MARARGSALLEASLGCGCGGGDSLAAEQALLRRVRWCSVYCVAAMSQLAISKGHIPGSGGMAVSGQAPRRAHLERAPHSCQDMARWHVSQISIFAIVLSAWHVSVTSWTCSPGGALHCCWACWHSRFPNMETRFPKMGTPGPATLGIARWWPEPARQRRNMPAPKNTRKVGRQKYKEVRCQIPKARIVQI